MNIYQILETLRQVEESTAQVGDRVQCPNNITGTIVSDAGSHWVIIDDHAETEDDTLEFRKSDCRVIDGLGEGQMKHHMWDMAERLDLDKFLEMFPDSKDFWLGVHGIDADEYDQIQNDWERDHPEIHDTDVKENDDDDYESDEGDYQDDPRVHVKQTAVLPDHVQQQIMKNPAMRADIISAYKRQQGMAEGTAFKFANPKQRPGDQVRGTEPARKKKSSEHPFKGRLVGAMESEQMADEAKATKTRLDPKCWSGKKIGTPKTKVKGGVRVNNCVPVEEEYEEFMNELVGTYGMTSGGTATGDAQKTDPEQAKQVAKVQQNVNKLKSAGVPIPSGQQAVQSLMKDPVKDPQSQLDKTIDAGLGQQVQNVVTKGNDSDVNQLTALIRKINQSSGA